MCLDVRGRQLGSAFDDLVEDRPKPLPRQKHLQGDDDVRLPVPASRTSPNVLDHKMRKTPTDRQPITPTDWRNSPAGDRDQFANRHNFDNNDRSHRYGESRRSPIDRRDFADRKSPHSDMFRKSPLDRHEFEEEKEELFQSYDARQKSPSERLGSAGTKSPLADRRQSSTLRRQSSFEDDTTTKFDRQKSPGSNRKSPVRDRRKTPVGFQQKAEGSPSAQRKGSVIDFLTESTGVKENASSDEEQKHRARKKSGSPQLRGRKSTSPSSKRSESTEKNPFDNVCKSPGATSRISRQNRSTDGLDTKPSHSRSQVISAAVF